MYAYDDLRFVHLELTSKCNASCPMCARNFNGGPVVPGLPLKDLTLQDIKQIFTPDFLKKLKSIFVCGTYGEPILAKDALDIFKYFKECNPQVDLTVVTNGSARSPEWWREIAAVTNWVQFSIDGLEDTNSIYRRGTNFESIMRNAEHFISAGGIARWEYLVFKHNEHQVEKAQQMAKAMGFKEFRLRRSGRFNEKDGKVEKHAVINKNYEFEYFIESPDVSDFVNPALNVKLENREMHIDCRAVKEKGVYIDFNGIVTPCCWLGTFVNSTYAPYKTADVQNLIATSRGGIDRLSGLKYSVSQIVESDFFQNIVPKSWSSSRPLKCCEQNCNVLKDKEKGQHL